MNMNLGCMRSNSVYALLGCEVLYTACPQREGQHTRLGTYCLGGGDWSTAKLKSQNAYFKNHWLNHKLKSICFTLQTADIIY